MIAAYNSEHGIPTNTKPSGAPKAPDLSVVREWAREREIPVADKGRVSIDTLRAYRKYCEENGLDMPPQVASAISAGERVDRLEVALRGNGTHISQHS